MILPLKYEPTNCVCLQILHTGTYTEDIIISRDKWATACLIFNLEECTKLLCQAILTSDDVNNQQGGNLTNKKYAIISAVGWIINKANDFWLSPANIDDNIIWPTQEAIEERTIVSNFVDNFIENIKLLDDKAGQPDELQSTSFLENVEDEILLKFKQIYDKAVKTSSFKDSYEIFEYLIRAYDEGRDKFIGGVSLNPDDYFKAYLSHSDINLVTNTIITSLVKDLGHEHLNEWRTSPIIKLITYQCVGHIRARHAKMFVTSAKSGDRRFLTKEEINQLNDTAFTTRLPEDVRTPVESQSQNYVESVMYQIVESNIYNDVSIWGQFPSSSAANIMSQSEYSGLDHLATSNQIIELFSEEAEASSSSSVINEFERYQLKFSGEIETDLPSWTEKDYMTSQERPQMLLKSEEIAKMALIFTSDSLAGCKCLMKKIFNTTELQGMNWSGRPSINGGHKHAAFIKNPKTFFIFYFLRLMKTSAKLKVNWDKVHEDTSIQLEALTDLEFYKIKQHIFIDKATKTKITGCMSKGDLNK
ncbi:uncharacterized protein LOC110843024 isoform X2 [Folsomia candida]|uniref:uncharacterized protein LOC110843024 isoform X2 n=1 Tax=Folsomia candida TaxID=158441 RepID=UPI001604D8AB|nr:uncharacterized protein LOC110843024 isoform X2 [Folsomia candida]